MRSGAAPAPDGAWAAGKVLDPIGFGHAIKQLLARTEITATHALVAVNDVIATFRVLDFPIGASDQEIGVAVAKGLSMDPERIVTRWVEVAGHDDRRVVYAAAWDRTTVQGITDAVRAAGLDPTAMELKSAAVARTVSEPSCAVLDLVASPAEIVLVDGSLPHQWHAFELPAQATDIAEALAVPLRSVIRFHQRKRGSTFGPTSPVLISTEQAMPPQIVLGLQDLVGQPVRMIVMPSRVPPQVRHATYLTCLGLIMRRDS